MIYILISNLISMVLIIIAYDLGVKSGQSIDNKKIKKIPDIRQLFTESKDKKEVEKESEKLNTILGNIENYDGTSKSQKDVI